MPWIAPQNNVDRIEHTRKNVVPVGDGDLSLEPTNYHENYTFRELNEKNDPVGFRIGVQDEPDGYYFLIGENAKGADTMAAQNTASLSLNRPSFFASQPWVAGPPAATKLTAAKVRTPQAPLIQLVDSGQMGFNAGDYLLAYTYEDDGGRQTDLSVEAPTTVPTNNYSIRIPLPQDQVEGAKYLCVYMTPQNGDNSMFYLQRKIDVSRSSPKDYLLSGPFRFGERPPTTNQTFLGRAPTPPRLWPVPSHSSVTQPGFYEFAISWVTRSGESLSGVFANTLSIPAPRLGYRIMMYRPDPAPPGVIGWRPWVLYTMEPTGFAPMETYIPVWLPFDPSGETYIPIDTKQWPVNGFTGSGGGGDAGAAFPSGSGYERMVQGERPKEDTSGIETPNTPFENITFEGTQVLDPGPYYFAVAHALREGMGLPSPPVKANVLSGKLPRILPANPVNYFPNAEGIEVDLAGKPFDHSFAPGLGSISLNAGVIAISSNGAQTTSSPVHKLESRPMDVAKEFEIGEELLLWNYIAGTAAVYLEQLDASDVVVSRQKIKNITELGPYNITVKVRKATGAESQGALLSDGTITFAGAADTVRLSHEMEGATRNMDFRVSNIYARPTAVGVPRKRIVPPPGANLPSDTNPPAETPFPNVGTGSVEQPPSPPSFAPIEALSRVDFESGALPGGAWSAVASGATLEQLVNAPAAIDGSYGLWLNNSSQAAANWVLRQTFGPTTRTQIGARFKMRTDQVYQLGWAPLMVDAADGTHLTWVEFDARYGALYFHTRDTGRSTLDNSKVIPLSIKTDDVFDVEFLVAYDPSSGKGTSRLLVGKNGATRYEISSWLSMPWGSGKNPRTASVGVNYNFTSGYGKNYTLHFDSIAITESGDSLVQAVSQPALEPIATPDRPTSAGPVLAQATFEGGTIDTGFSAARSPLDATTSVSVTSAAGIESTYGARCIDANTTTSAFAYITNTSIPGGNRATGGWVVRFGATALPSAGNYTIIQIDGSSGNPLANAYLSSIGELYVRVYNAAGTIVKGPQKVAAGIAGGGYFDAELIAYNAGGAGGSLACWVTKSTGDRQLMELYQGIDWTSSLISGVKAGLISSTVASSTATLDIDALKITEEGSILFEEADEEGNPLYQVHCYFPEGTPVQERGLFLETDPDEPLSVEPGKEYTAAVSGRLVIPVDQEEAAMPFFYVARDLDGQLHPLGSLYGDAGVRGVVPWDQKRRTFVIPPNCYEVFMESRNIGAGEFVAQGPVWTGVDIPEGEKVPLARTFPPSGSARISIDCRTRHPQLPLSRRWIDIIDLIDLEEGSAVSARYQSSLTVGGPFTEPTSDITEVPQDNFLHVLYDYTSDTTTSGVVRQGSPLLDYIVYLGGAPADVLLREDGTEFPGAVLLSGVIRPRNLSNADIRLPRTDRAQPFRINDPVAKLPAFSIHAYTEEAAQEIEETCLFSRGERASFWADASGRRMRLQFRQQITFDWQNVSIKRYDRTSVEGSRKAFPLTASVAEGTEVYDYADVAAAYL